MDKPAAIALIPKDVTLNMGLARTNDRILVAVKGSHWADDETWATSRWSRTKNRPKALASVLVCPKTKQLFKNIGTEGSFGETVLRGSSIFIITEGVWETRKSRKRPVSGRVASTSSLIQEESETATILDDIDE